MVVKFAWVSEKARRIPSAAITAFKSSFAPSMVKRGK